MNPSALRASKTSDAPALWTAGVLYSAIVLVCAACHEAWFDEAQAWLLARDASVPELLTRYARWEGSPSLWHVLLIPFARGGFPYTGLSYISATLAIAGVILFLWRSPFPLWMRVLLPFTYFPLFQYSVVARSYALVLPLVCGIAILFSTRISKHLVWYFVLLVLLANVSFHCTIVAGVLFLEWLWTAWRSGTIRRRPILMPALAAAFALLYFLIYLELRIPLGVSLHVGMDHPMNAGTIRFLKQVSEAFWGGMGSNPYRTFSTLVGFFVIGISFWRFGRSTSGFIFAASTFLLLVLAGLKHAAPWHAGVIFLVWILALWIFFEQHPAMAARSRVFLLVVAVILFAQTIFGLETTWFDLFRPYSGSRETAAYLAATGQDKRNLYAIGFKAFAIQPYFRQDVFSRQEHGRRQAFYLWPSDLDHPDFADIAQRKPDAIVLSPWDPRIARHLKELGYCEEKHFEGAIWWKNAIAEPDTYSLLIPCR